jgi:hypothetical protein
MAGTIYTPNDVTLGAGVQVTSITVTTTATSLGDLIDTAVSGKAELQGRRELSLHNTDGSAVVYILEASDQTVADGWELAADEKVTFSASRTFTGNLIGAESSIGDGTQTNETGFYLAVSSGTVTVKVLESK